MNRLPSILFAALLVCAAWFGMSDVDSMPEQIAVHFEAGGAVNGWTTHAGYKIFILAFVLGLPIGLVGLMAGLPRLTNGAGQIPNNAHWFAPERRQTTMAFLNRHACWLGCMTVAATYGVHLAILRANASSPPTVDVDRLVTLSIVYVLGLVWWTMTLIRQFRKSGD